MVKVLAIIFTLVASLALAQQPQQQTAIDRMSIVYGQCIGQWQQQVDQIAGLQQQIATLQGRIKELESKPEEKKE